MEKKALVSWVGSVILLVFGFVVSVNNLFLIIQRKATINYYGNKGYLFVYILTTLIAIFLTLSGFLILLFKFLRDRKKEQPK